MGGQYSSSSFILSGFKGFFGFLKYNKLINDLIMAIQEEKNAAAA